MSKHLSLTKILFAGASITGALGMMAVLGTPSAQAGQARVTGAALVDNDSEVSAVAGEVILAPGQSLGEGITITPDIDNIPNSENVAVQQLDIDFDIDDNEAALLEAAIANKISTDDFTDESDIISLVKNFGGVSSPLGQAQVTGAATFDTHNTLSAIAGQATLARGQLLAEPDNNDDPVATIDPTIEDEDDLEGEVLSELDINFSVEEDDIPLLEAAIADVVNDADFDRESDVISLVKAFTEESAGSSERVVGLE
ncbi:hypothetical protein FRE64_08075 [Euhalothece natronophila Z-M001]|uniref:Uncharacterized protein n=1 Tax=Euhalothece natronophila Z-M001 TaxID=522448 RepID=A0A5B8NKX6_9CHRO|nr:hypothetical protein [Euhalothece natronophila]QDZ39902.1 hypothetical protein FRE64_08075 [Euhalothece natronophila Z-M001]